MKSISSLKTVVGGLAAASLFVGCATMHMNQDKLVAAQGSIAGAQQAGAEQNPQAQLALKYASDELAEAKRLDAAGDGEAAQRLLERSQVDAEYALALTRQTQAEALAKRATEDARSTQ